MDPEREFVQTAKATAAKLLERGMKPTNYEGHLGWSVDYVHKESRRGSDDYRGWFEVYTEDWYVVLLQDGSFVRAGKWYTEGTDGDSPVHRISEVIGTRYFVGTTGKPFSQWIEKLQRRAYQ